MKGFTFVLLTMLSVMEGEVVAGSVAQSTNAVVSPQSIFVMPANPQEGRDPFYPASSRPYQAAIATSAKTAEVNISLFSLQGVSGQSPNRLAIINKRTFAAGDNLDVSTSQGRIRIHCLEIGDNSVVIEVNGQRHELRFDGQQ
jgi:hypothetical protein